MSGIAPPDVSAASLARSKEHTSELQSPCNLVCRLLLEKKKKYSSDRSIYRPGASFFQEDWPAACGQCSGQMRWSLRPLFFFFNDTATTEIYTLSLHDALPI